MLKDDYSTSFSFDRGYSTAVVENEYEEIICPKCHGENGIGDWSSVNPKCDVCHDAGTIAIVRSYDVS